MTARRRGNGDGSVRRRPNGLWEASLRYGDPITGARTRLSLYAPTRADAVAKLDAARDRLRHDRRPRAQRVTLATFLAHWLDDVIRPSRRPATVASYAVAVDRLCALPLGAVSIADLTPAFVQSAFARRPATRSTEVDLLVLKAALSKAVAYGLIATNPAAGVRPPHREPRELRVLSLEQVRRFLHVARADRYAALYTLALDTGMRRGELLALRWSDVDLDRALVHVVRSYDPHTHVIGPVKTRASRRQIVISAPTVAQLRAHRATSATPLVFCGRDGGPLNPDRFRRRSFLPLQRAAGIDPPIRFHDLRHTAATLMLLAGIQPKVVSERLGHASVTITLDVYQHVLPSLQTEAATRIGALLDGGTRGGTPQRRPGARKRKTPAS